jgi:hypothetical protein
LSAVFLFARIQDLHHKEHEGFHKEHKENLSALREVLPSCP